MSKPDPSTPRSASRRDLYWLIAALSGAALLHFGWTVPRGPFEFSKRNQDRSHAAFVALQEKYGDRSFQDEPKGGVFAPQMRRAVTRAVQLVRTQAIAAGAMHWYEATKVSCKTLRCRFVVCIPDAQSSQFDAGLKRFEIAKRPAWELERREGEGCPRYEVRFLERPSPQRLLSLGAE